MTNATKIISLASTLLLAACGGGSAALPPAVPGHAPAANAFTAKLSFACDATRCTPTGSPAAIATSPGGAIHLTLTGLQDVGCDGRLTDGVAQLSLLDPNGGLAQSYSTVDNGNGSQATYSATVPATGTYTWTLAGSAAACHAATGGASGTYTQTITGTVSP
jgi:hypothetical protein